MHHRTDAPLNIAVIGTGIAGMSAAWLLSRKHRVTLYERDSRLGGHSNTIEIPAASGPMPVDTGFIVYNEATYPNLTALFDYLGVRTAPSVMSFAVSLDGGKLEYSGTDLNGLFAQRGNIVSPRFWSMLRDLYRFYREAPGDAAEYGLSSLGYYLTRKGFGEAFRDDHLLPMAAAIWSAPAEAMLHYPVESFIRFCDNHGLLKLANRPVWRTVAGGSREYIRKLTALYAEDVHLGRAAQKIIPFAGGVRIVDAAGATGTFDHVVVAAHADQALAMIHNPTAAEREILGAFRYSRNLAVVHRDAALMPKRRAAWSSWNYLGERRAPESMSARGDRDLCVTYWMNRLQELADPAPVFVTLNPCRAPRPESVLHEEAYEHPIFDRAAMQAQQLLWSLQGERNIWFCGAYFGSGFHEDGLQSGLAVAEQLGDVRRPWQVANESGRIALGPNRARPRFAEAVS